jgi:hypothetical protein
MEPFLQLEFYRTQWGKEIEDTEFTCIYCHNTVKLCGKHMFYLLKRRESFFRCPECTARLMLEGDAGNFTATIIYTGDRTRIKRN